MKQKSTKHCRPHLESLESRNMLASDASPLTSEPLSEQAPVSALMGDMPTHTGNQAQAMGTNAECESRPRFSRGRIVYTYSYSNLLGLGLNGLSQTQIKRGVETALKVWAKYVKIKFVEVADRGPRVSDNTYGQCNLTTAPIIRFGQHQLGSALGHAYFMLNRTSGGFSIWTWQGLAGDVHFNSNTQWNYKLFRYVATHELGHSLGLTHSKVAGAVMEGATPDQPRWQTWDRDLHPNDIRRIRRLYDAGRGLVVTQQSSVADAQAITAENANLSRLVSRTTDGESNSLQNSLESTVVRPEVNLADRWYSQISGKRISTETITTQTGSSGKDSNAGRSLTEQVDQLMAADAFVSD